MRGEGHLGRLFHVVLGRRWGDEGEGWRGSDRGANKNRPNAGLSLFVFGVNDLTDHEQITNRSRTEPR